jgi:hypothetical protein
MDHTNSQQSQPLVLVRKAAKEASSDVVLAEESRASKRAHVILDRFQKSFMNSTGGDEEDQTPNLKKRETAELETEIEELRTKVKKLVVMNSRLLKKEKDDEE